MTVPLEKMSELQEIDGFLRILKFIGDFAL